MLMQVAINAHTASARYGGIGTYTTMLLREYYSRTSLNLQIRLVRHRRGLAPFDFVAPTWPETLVPHPSLSSGTWVLAHAYVHQRLLPKALEHAEVALYHSPTYQVPLEGDFLKIATVHDLIPDLFPQWEHPSSVLYFRRWARRCADAADLIITVSEYSAQCAIDHWGISPQKIAVIPLAASPVFSITIPRQLRLEVLTKFGLDERTPLFLYVGGTHPRKNLATICQSFTKIKSSIPGNPVMLLAGCRPTSDRPVPEGDGIIATDFVPDIELAALYQSATAFLFPSYSEGFGLPPLEAMASGCPVIASNTSSIPEVVGTVPVLLDPGAPDAWSEAMYQVATSPELRERLSREGRLHAQQRTWANVADETLATYQRVLGTIA